MMMLLINGKLDEYLHDIDEECYERMEFIMKQMEVGEGIWEELKASNQMKWVRLMNNVRSKRTNTCMIVPISE